MRAAILAAEDFHRRSRKGKARDTGAGEGTFLQRLESKLYPFGGLYRSSDYRFLPIEIGRKRTVVVSDSEAESSSGEDSSDRSGDDDDNDDGGLRSGSGGNPGDADDGMGDVEPGGEGSGGDEGNDEGDDDEGEFLIRCLSAGVRR